MKLKKLKKFIVKMEREILFTAEVEVEAENEDVAKDMAVNIADAGGGYWMEQDCLSQTAKAKVIKTNEAESKPLQAMLIETVSAAMDPRTPRTTVTSKGQLGEWVKPGSTGASSVEQGPGNRGPNLQQIPRDRRKP